MNVNVVRLVALCIVATVLAHEARCEEWRPKWSTESLLDIPLMSIGEPNDGSYHNLGEKLHNGSTAQTWVIKELVFLLPAERENKGSSYRVSVEFSDQRELSPNHEFAYVGDIVEPGGDAQSSSICDNVDQCYPFLTKSQASHYWEKK